MKAVRISLAVVAVLSLLGLTGYAFANAPEEGKMSGVIVAEKNASLEVEDQAAVAGSITVAEVKVPHDSWVVVHVSEDGKPGMRLGYQRIEKGASREVRVKLEDSSPTGKVIVAAHYDGGTQGEFEFDMDRFATSPDKPYFVDGMELGMEISVR